MTPYKYLSSCGLIVLLFHSSPAQMTQSCFNPVTLYVEHRNGHPVYRIDQITSQTFPLGGVSRDISNGCRKERRLDVLLGTGTSDGDVSVAYNAIQKLQARDAHVYYLENGMRREVMLPKLEDSPPD